MMNPGRNVRYAWCRNGYNTQQKDDEVYGAGNLFTAQFWEYDTRKMIRLNTDKKYMANESRYAVNGDNPNIYVDPLGDFRHWTGAAAYKLRYGGEIRKDKASGEWFVGKQRGVDGGVAYRRRFDWNRGNKPYTGSGWLDTERSFVAHFIGLNGKSSGLISPGLNSLLESQSVELSGDMLERVKNDPAVQKLEQDIINDVKNNCKYGQEAFTMSYGRGVQLGGERGSLNPLEESSSKTWAVAVNPFNLGSAEC